MLNIKRSLPVLLVLVIAIGMISDSIWIYGKAKLAQILIKQAWQETLLIGTHVKPWPWADTWPIARVQFPEHKVDLYILQGVGGNSLAFGPGYLPASGPLGSSKTSLIAGHRDTHFKFLQDVNEGALLELTLANGDRKQYKVFSTEVVDSQYKSINLEDSVAAIVLVTCYPFNMIRSGGSLRYLVNAIEV